MKIGIVTQYYRSENYGGNLQAYALCRAINKLGFDAEQICYDASSGKQTSSQLQNGIGVRLKRYLKNPIRAIRVLENKIYRRMVRDNKILRSKAFCSFNLGVINHSELVYGDDDIVNSNDVYDLFITGSDQVWNTKWYNSVYFLNFVRNDKFKMSYAASVSKFSLDEEEKNIFRNEVRNYLAVSVRERTSVDLLKDVIEGTEIEWNLDPTLILDCEDWDEIASPRIENERYVLGFYISGDSSFRKAAVKFAKNKGLKYIELPVYEKNFHYSDRNMYSIGPAEFLSLIKYSDYVFTDSFHASVFSIMFDIEFFVFSRKDHPAMKSRLIDLTELFDCSSRLCDSEEKYAFSYLESINGTAYVKKSEKYLKMKETSIAYLKNNLNKVLDYLSEGEIEG